MCVVYGIQLHRNTVWKCDEPWLLRGTWFLEDEHRVLEMLELVETSVANGVCLLTYYGKIEERFL